MPGVMSPNRSFGVFRKVLHTGLYSQFVAMEVPVNGEIGDEVSPSSNDQCEQIAKLRSPDPHRWPSPHLHSRNRQGNRCRKGTRSSAERCRYRPSRHSTPVLEYRKHAARSGYYLFSGRAWPANGTSDQGRGRCTGRGWRGWSTRVESTKQVWEWEDWAGQGPIIGIMYDEIINWI